MSDWLKQLDEKHLDIVTSHIYTVTSIEELKALVK